MVSGFGLFGCSFVRFIFEGGGLFSFLSWWVGWGWGGGFVISGGYIGG